MRFGVIVFPGSNCDLDAYYLVRDVLKKPVEYIYYNQSSIGQSDVIILPGGFTYGDYLRSGAIARFSPVMSAVADFAERGGIVLGICNGFQVLTEAGLLPGALYRNNHLQFRCEQVYVRIENNNLPLTCAASEGDLLKMPIAHGDGNYYASPELLQELEENRQIVFRYSNQDGSVEAEDNPNGSTGNIAGVCNLRGNVTGLMPHPERAGEIILGSEDGLILFNSIIRYLENREVF
ncbi:MAG: phosphoribosylformylglycinamidine synthase subunit PurQ [Bacillota bacterium]